VSSSEEVEAIEGLIISYAKEHPLGLEILEEQLSSLPGIYQSPTGILLLAYTTDNQATGCVFLRPLLDTSLSTAETSLLKVCEVKRLYCLPEKRGIGIGVGLAR